MSHQTTRLINQKKRTLRMGMKSNGGGKSGGKGKGGKGSGCSNDITVREEEGLHLSATYCSGLCIQEASPSPLQAVCSSIDPAQQWTVQYVPGTPAFQLVGASGLCYAVPACDYGFLDVVMAPCSSPLTQFIFTNGSLTSWGCWGSPLLGTDKMLVIDMDANGGACAVGDVAGATEFDDPYYNDLLFLDQCIIENAGL